MTDDLEDLATALSMPWEYALTAGERPPGDGWELDPERPTAGPRDEKCWRRPGVRRMNLVAELQLGTVASGGVFVPADRAEAGRLTAENAALRHEVAVLTGRLERRDALIDKHVLDLRAGLLAWKTRALAAGLEPCNEHETALLAAKTRELGLLGDLAASARANRALRSSAKDARRSRDAWRKKAMHRAATPPGEATTQ